MGRKVQKVKFPAAAPKQKRVAAYARVSCGKDAMLHSLASQVDYYRSFIRRHPGWEYAGVYADEAKTGTKDSREQFQRMLADCRAGKIDHIVTKSISRLAWNPTLLGYRYDGGTYHIEPTEAETVRLIFDSYLEGMGATAIAKMLNESTAVSRFVNGWGQRSIMAILQNDTYTGNLMLQKKYTVDFLTKTMKVNEGEVPQYYVEDSHPAIIKPAKWEAVQVEMEQRRSKGKRHDCSSPFSGKIFCGDRGGVYGSQTWHSTDKYRRVIWQCNHKYGSGEKCGTPHLREEDLKDLFVQALGQYVVKI